MNHSSKQNQLHVTASRQVLCGHASALPFSFSATAVYGHGPYKRRLHSVRNAKENSQIKLYNGNDDYKSVSLQSPLLNSRLRIESCGRPLGSVAKFDLFLILCTFVYSFLRNRRKLLNPAFSCRSYNSASEDVVSTAFGHSTQDSTCAQLGSQSHWCAASGVL